MQQYKYTGRNTLVEIHKGKYTNTNTNHDRCCIYCFIISLSFSVTSVAKLQIANYDDHCRYHCHFLCSKKSLFQSINAAKHICPRNKCIRNSAPVLLQDFAVHLDLCITRQREQKVGNASSIASWTMHTRMG